MDREEEYIIDQGNELIASFMGYSRKVVKYEEKIFNSSNEYYWHEIEGELWVDSSEQPVDDEHDSLSFHSDWNELMAVVEKIEGLDLYDRGVCITIRGIICKIELLSYKDKVICEYTGVNSNDKMHNTWCACVDFIKRFNNDEL